MHECRVYANRDHVSGLTRPFVNDLCRALWSEGTTASRMERYGSRVRRFVAVDAPQEADQWILPLIWNYYLEHDSTLLALQEAGRASRAGYRLTIFSQGDFPAELPFGGATLVEQSAYAHRRNWGGNRVYAQPAFMPDYVEVYCGGRLQFREKGNRPVVGFCGQAGGSKLDLACREAITRLRRFAYAAKWRKWEPPSIETTRLRMRVLNEVARHQGIESNFIVRRRYRAGYSLKERDPFHPTRLEFLRNILNTDYTLCVRGVGNFSARFYETLALGRIPIFVNTNCILPYDEKIDYREYCVWVEESEIPRISEKILDFHESISPSQFRGLQAACRCLWQQWLSMDGFYAKFSKNLTSDPPSRTEKSQQCA